MCFLCICLSFVTVHIYIVPLSIICTHNLKGNYVRFLFNTLSLCLIYYLKCYFPFLLFFLLLSALSGFVTELDINLTVLSALYFNGLLLENCVDQCLKKRSLKYVLQVKALRWHQ